MGRFLQHSSLCGLFRRQPWLWAPIVFVVDFATKLLVLGHEEMLRAQVNLVGQYVRLIYVRNPGSAMGLFPVGRAALVAVSILASIFIVYLYRTADSARYLSRGAMAAILGGAVGNLVDRIFYDGHVVDFIDVGFGTHRFYTFNVADVGVSVGGAVLFLCILLEGRTHE